MRSHPSGEVPNGPGSRKGASGRERNAVRRGALPRGTPGRSPRPGRSPGHAAAAATEHSEDREVYGPRCALEKTQALIRGSGAFPVWPAGALCKRRLLQWGLLCGRCTTGRELGALSVFTSCWTATSGGHSVLRGRQGEASRMARKTG